uniref:Thiol:disulfide interchange protein n=1 Tax=Magnetococcus massalia (strain MO-1) TaxID=451514 RepID=A0A1S7LQ14_MAGMO|nr:Putative periplasmic protein disulfide isomerase I. thiol: disulfide interchange protein dsbA [Candidatus Magnetococcus massalia]
MRSTMLHALKRLSPLFIAMLAMLAMPVSAMELELEEDHHYDVIYPPVSNSQPGLHVFEVFNFKCPHCFDLHAPLTAWKNRVKGKINVHSLPIYWGNQTDTPVRALFAAEFLGKGDAMKEAIFKAQFEDDMNIESLGDMRQIAKKAGVDPDALSSAMGSFGVMARVAQAKSLADAFGVRGTPTLVVNGRYRVGLGKHASGEPAKLFQILEGLSAR